MAEETIVAGVLRSDSVTKWERVGSVRLATLQLGNQNAVDRVDRVGAGSTGKLACCRS